MLERAKACDADAIWIDLEDSVPLAEKDAARRLAAAAVPTFTTVPVFVRINDVASTLCVDDIDGVVQPGLYGVLVPKIDSADDVKIVDYLLGAAERHGGLPYGQVRIGATIETARAAARCRDVLAASQRVCLVVVGTAQDGDMQRELGYQWSPDGLEMLHVRAHVLLEGRAAGIANLVEGPYVAYQDDEGLRSEARRGRQLGYTGKAAVHPRQLQIINEVFSPSPEEVAYFARVVAAMEQAYSEGVATATLDGKMIDTAMLARARQVLALANADSEVRTRREQARSAGRD